LFDLIKRDIFSQTQETQANKIKEEQEISRSNKGQKDKANNGPGEREVL